jgi:Tfp pilus assembly protein PilV
MRGGAFCADARAEDPDLMDLPNLTRTGRDEAGIAIVEVLVSALVLLVFSVGIFTVLTGSTRATAQERHRTQANALAEQELERVRSFRIADLVGLNSTRRVLEDGTQLTGACPTTGAQSRLTCYTIASSAQFQNEPAATSGCSAGPGSRDYLLLTINVSWTGMGVLHPVTAATIVSPPSGSLVPNSGSILVNVVDSRNVGIQGVAVSGSGPGSFSGSTGPTGCVLWRNLAVGTYTLSVGGTAAGMVDKDGNPPNTPPLQTTSVVDTGTNTVNLMYDRPGALRVAVKTLNYSGAVTDSTADGISARAPLMNLWKPFTSANSSTITTTQTLFPFVSPTTYSVYAGTCPSNNPDPSSAGANPLAFANVTVPASGIGTGPDNLIQLPSLRLTVRTGSSSSSQGSVVSGADVHITDTNCNPTVPRILATNDLGELADATGSAPTDPGLPYSANVAGVGGYKVCADANISGVQRMNWVRTGSSIEQVGLTDPTQGVARTIYLTASNATSGVGAQCSP